MAFEIFSYPDYKKIILQIVEDWENLGLPSIDKSKLNFKLLPFRKVGLHSLLNFMIFSEGELLLVIKMPRYKDGRLAFAALENEARMLEYLKKKKILTGHIPQVYKLLYLEDVPVLLLKAYHGEMLHHFLDKEEDLSKINELITGGAELLLQLYDKQESTPQTIDEEFIQKYIMNPLRLIAEYYPQHIVNIEKYLSTFFEGKGFLNMKYPSLCLHQEFNPWNILREPNGNLIVLDWEDATTEGLPLLDVYNYFEVCLRILFIGESKRSKERDPDQKKKRAEALLKSYSDFMDKYCKILNIQLELKDLFFVIFAVNASHFFLEEKRREIDYAKSWLSLLLDASLTNCFENHVKGFFKQI